ncbi:MAG: flagellar hook capping FlgD N-terminal domain-containing protein [Sulfitobacter sp.]
MDVTTSTNTVTSALNAATTNASSESGPVISSDFETFLKMLTAQAKYQDPLEPIESTEYAAQLAQFSMVEQQVKGNDLLTALGAQLGTGNIAQMAGWIGMEAQTTAPVLFDGTPIDIQPRPAAISDEVFLNVKDQTGATVQRLSIPVSAAPISWAGVAENGTPFQPGIYSFEIESRSNGEVILSEPASSYARITEARLESGQQLLILEGGAAILANDVSALREAT